MNLLKLIKFTEETSKLSPNDAFKSPYEISNKETLAKELSNVNDKLEMLSDKIVAAYKRNEFSLKIGMASESNFDRFSTLIKNSISLNNLLDGTPDIQQKLADLVSLAYYYAQRDPEKRYRVYSNKDTASQVSNAIFMQLTSSLKMSFLTYDTEFAKLLKQVIFSVIFYPKSEATHKK